ncbi:hypothetical protein [Nocardia cyriacigeorgica]|uniref:hypothetical protein n=1 Tax=Nocardia cyriacigeorgica TaxID=135487 RepID=UPI0018931B9C|nr:hypothetical protein [Nocardia cyriacigeorgica]MBF6412288.1 hypothetical protein [Nocardia cyriacigeorgica]
MVEPLETPEQVRRYLADALTTAREFWVLECRHGWVCQTVLTAEELASGEGVGLGNYVVNKQTGVITAHSSLAPATIGEQYDEAIRTGGRVQGYQVYPPMWRVDIQRIWETPDEIEYRVRARPQTQPLAEPPTERQLVIYKETLKIRTNSRAIHESVRQATAWAEARSRQDGTWPQSGTFEF